MKATPVSRLSYDDISDAPRGGYVWRIVDFLNSAFDNIIQILRNNVTISDNIYSQTIEYEFEHDKQVVFKNKLRTRPYAIFAGWCEGEYPRISTGFNQNNEILLTVRFDGGATTKKVVRIIVFGS